MRDDLRTLKIRSSKGKQMKEVYVTTIQEREMLACAPFTEAASNQDIRVDSVFNPADDCKLVSTIITNNPLERSVAIAWLRRNGFNPVFDANKVMFS